MAAVPDSRYIIASTLPEILYMKMMDCEEVLVEGLDPGVVPILPADIMPIEVELNSNRKLKVRAKGFKLACAFSITVE
jgi:hypothetical protein